MIAMPILATEPDVVTRMALGALRFIDPITGHSVTEGLSVLARIGNKKFPATPSNRGVHLFHQLPGMSDTSFRGEPTDVPLEYEFNIEVRDTLRRYFSTSFKTKFDPRLKALPVCPELATLGKKIPLYTTPWRMPRNDWATIRGTLWVFTADKPAAWALLRVYRAVDNKFLVEGVADKDGIFMLMFLWPKPEPQVIGVPYDLHWKINIEAFYDAPATQIPDGENILPALCSILQQKKVTLLANIVSNVELNTQKMISEQTLLLKTDEQNVLYLK